MTGDAFSEWLSFLEARHLADLTFPEVSRSLRALSSAYVERRKKLSQGTALSGNGKRAAFALFYGPIHFLLLRHIVTEVPQLLQVPGGILDLGCGTGAAGAAWASARTGAGDIHGVDRHPWAAAEARETYRIFGLRGRTRVDDVATATFPAQSAILLAFTVNEVGTPVRDRLLPRLLTHAERGNRVLIVEPLAGFVAPWWPEWQRAFQSSGGHADEWRIRAPLPAIVEKLDRASGLHHHEITGRTLWI